MLETLSAMLSYGFLLRALIAGTLMALCAALLGVSLVLRRTSMIGDGLSHVGFGALSVAMAVGVAPLLVAIPVVIAAAFLLLHVAARSRMGGDAAIALISSSALAIGVIATSLSEGSNADLNGYLFGSILAVGPADLHLILVLSATVLLLYMLCYHRIFAVTFDSDFARATGVDANLYDTLLAVLTAVTIVTGMRMMGALLISSLIIFPALTAMRLCHSFRAVVIMAAMVAAVCFVSGMVASYALSLPAGPSIVMANLTAFGLSSLVRAVRGA
ncbi:MAG: metal ABC transporter permease [Oscillospiraceae bacterium]